MMALQAAKSPLNLLLASFFIATALTSSELLPRPSSITCAPTLKQAAEVLASVISNSSIEAHDASFGGGRALKISQQVCVSHQTSPCQAWKNVTALLGLGLSCMAEFSRKSSVEFVSDVSCLTASHGRILRDVLGCDECPRGRWFSASPLCQFLDRWENAYVKGDSEVSLVSKRGQVYRTVKAIAPDIAIPVSRPLQWIVGEQHCQVCLHFDSNRYIESKEIRMAVPIKESYTRDPREAIMVGFPNEAEVANPEQLNRSIQEFFLNKETLSEEQFDAFIDQIGRLYPRELSEMIRVLVNKLNEAKEISIPMVRNRLKIVGAVASQDLWTQDLQLKAMDLVLALDNIGVNLLATEETALIHESGITLSYKRLGDEEHGLPVELDDHTQLRLSLADKRDSKGTIPQTKLVTVSHALPSQISLLPVGKPRHAVMSKMVHVSLYSGRRNSSTSKISDTPVLLRLPNQANFDNLARFRRSCVFLDPSSRMFNSSGCKVVVELSDSTTTVCHCTHLSSFSVLVSHDEVWADFESQHLLQSHSNKLAILTYVCVGLSMLCLLLTCITYITVQLGSTSVGDDRSIATLHKVHCCLCSSLLVAHTLFLLGSQLGNRFGEVTCKILSLCTVYFFLAVFCWLMCESFMFVKSIILVLPRADSTFARVKLWHQFVSSYLAPFLILTPVVVFRWNQVIQYEYTFSSYAVGFRQPKLCWFSSEFGTSWAFVGPVLLVCGVNLVVFSVIVVKLSRRAHSSMRAASDSDVAAFMRKQMKMSVTLASLLGLTWLLSVLFLFAQGNFLLSAHYLFVLLNGLQGCFIFATQIVGHEKVREAWERRLLRCRYLPASLHLWIERRRARRLGSSGGGVAEPGSQAYSVISAVRRLFRRERQTSSREASVLEMNTQYVTVQGYSGVC